MENEEICTARFRSKFGDINIAATERGILSLDFCASTDNFTRELYSRYGASVSIIKDNSSIFSPLFKLLEGFFSGEGSSFDIALDLRGTPFQLAVWRELKGVPFGSVISYAELAKRAGSPGGARAAGSACGANPVPLIVPCHRVVTSAGKIGGYSAGLNADASGGVSLKKALLHQEGVEI